MTQTVRTVNIRGKEYVDVAERVRLCNADQGFSMVGQERYSIGDRHFFSVTILVKDKQFIGDAEIKFAAPKNSPDGTNPIECAQTSALGRALGFAGYGTLESIASADEVLSALAAQESTAVQPANNAQLHSVPRSQPTVESMDQANLPINSNQLTAIKNMYASLGRDTPSDVQTLTYLKAKSVIQTLTAELSVAKQKQQSNRTAVAK